MKAEQRVGMKTVRVEYTPSKNNGRTADTLRVLVWDRGAAFEMRTATILDPDEDTVSLFFGCAEAGFIAPLVDDLMERMTNQAVYDVLELAADVFACGLVT